MYSLYDHGTSDVILLTSPAHLSWCTSLLMANTYIVLFREPNKPFPNIDNFHSLFFLPRLVFHFVFWTVYKCIHIFFRESKCLYYKRKVMDHL